MLGIAEHSDELPETVPPGTKVIAKDLYNQERADELNINEGDIITVHEAPEGGWWRGTTGESETDENSGWFPSTVVAMIRAQIPGDKPPPVKVGSQVIVKFQYLTTTKGELSLEEGDVIIVTECAPGSSSWRGMIGIGEKVPRIGMFPARNVEPLVVTPMDDPVTDIEEKAANSPFPKKPWYKKLVKSTASPVSPGRSRSNTLPVQMSEKEFSMNSVKEDSLSVTNLHRRTSTAPLMKSKESILDSVNVIPLSASPSILISQVEGVSNAPDIEIGKNVGIEEYRSSSLIEEKESIERVELKQPTRSVSIPAIEYMDEIIPAEQKISSISISSLKAESPSSYHKSTVDDLKSLDRLPSRASLVAPPKKYSVVSIKSSPQLNDIGLVQEQNEAEVQPLETSEIDSTATEYPVDYRHTGSVQDLTSPMNNLVKGDNDKSVTPESKIELFVDLMATLSPNSSDNPAHSENLPTTKSTITPGIIADTSILKDSPKHDESKKGTYIESQHESESTAPPSALPRVFIALNDSDESIAVIASSTAEDQTSRPRAPKIQDAMRAVSMSLSDAISAMDFGGMETEVIAGEFFGSTHSLKEINLGYVASRAVAENMLNLRPMSSIEGGSGPSSPRPTLCTKHVPVKIVKETIVGIRQSMGLITSEYADRVDIVGEKEVMVEIGAVDGLSMGETVEVQRSTSTLHFSSGQLLASQNKGNIQGSTSAEKEQVQHANVSSTQEVAEESKNETESYPRITSLSPATSFILDKSMDTDTESFISSKSLLNH